MMTSSIKIILKPYFISIPAINQMNEIMIAIAHSTNNFVRLHASCNINIRLELLLLAHFIISVYLSGHIESRPI